MKSLRSQLTFALGLSISLLLAVGGLAIFFVTREVMEEQFDDTLVAKATALITATEIDDEEFEIDLTVQDFAGFGSGGDDYFEVRRGDGRAMVRSPSLGSAGNALIPRFPLPAHSGTNIASGHLGDGRPARFFIRRFVPKDDDKKEYQDLHLVTASPTRELLKNLWILGIVIASVGGMMLVWVVPLLRLILAKGLRPLAHLSEQVRGIPASRFDERLDLTGQPEELVPLGASLNAWLGRMESGFEREKRFSSHAAHELRTPLSELKMIAELGATWPDQATPERFSEVMTIVDEMELLLQKLTLLARADAGREQVVLARVDLRSSIESVTDRVADTVMARRLKITSVVSDGELLTDSVMWLTILQNLIGNAVSHAPEGSEIRLEASPQRLCVSNLAPGLLDEDLEKLFERFWRKVTSHGDEAHSGLGLSIVRAYVGLLRGQCGLSLDGDERLHVEIIWNSGALEGS